ncbi:angiopoietin-related protein 2a isoform X1 [Salmo trutta]|uniref:Angiopoietin-like 2a n=1 Tax=Salmo trutta TaxID=8032 RepID=A0A674B8U1_SALTR|nr:angiopoietin-related protein 2-like isoform X1 [Salmo trutta]XP_029566356.1 angiopoietin-related protein 2-like isoform X2 [Salmo trutta]XP_029566357.1 angiopoietin-related protein 2-like isoform X1 [Salmo trutta]
MILPVVVPLVLLLVCGPGTTLQAEAEELESIDEVLEREFLYAGRTKRAVSADASSQVDKCSYTFIVPQQKQTGAICVNSKEPDSFLENRVNKQELELLNSELQKQRRQMESLQQLVEVDGGIVNEVKLLRKESRNMNARVTQLYMQLLHEIIRKRDNALEVSQLENRVLNHTSEMGRLASRYRDLEHKYQHLSALAGNQSAIIVQLEQHCRRGGQSYGGERERSRPVRPQPPVVPQQPTQQRPVAPPVASKPYQPPTYTRSNQITNEIQSDQNSKALPPPLPTMPSGTHQPSTTNKPSGPFKDCLAAVEEGHATSGMYLIKPENANRLMQVWCDQRHDPGGWTVIQRRQDGSVNFFRNWDTYKQGFGNIDGEYWLGLENIYWLTNQGNYKLLVMLEDWAGRKTFAEYASFRIEAEADFYKLRVGRYHGNAGDSLTWHNGKQFTTLDRDHDVYTGNCAHYQKGGWWYNACAHSNLNGVWYRGGHYRSRYQDGVYWAEFRGGAYSLKKVSMMIRPNPNTFH